MKKIIAAVLFIAIQISACAYSGSQAFAAQPAKANQIVLTVKGDGVAKATRYTLKQLQAMKKGTVSVAYSSVNNLPAGKFFAGKGVTISYLLKTSGVKQGAQFIAFHATDGYEQKIALSRINSTLYYFPDVINGTAAGKKTVPAILAWDQAENTNDLHKIKSGQLRFMLGQKTPNDITASDFVKYVYEIEVTKK